RLRGRLRGRPATAPAAELRAVVLPLRVREHTAGVLRLASEDGVRLTPEQARLLMALAYYAALGVERVRLVESAERAEAERRVESLRSALLTAVSHDLRTPLTTIKGIAHEIAHGADPARAAIVEAEADRLDALVGDLLDLSRIHAGAVRPNVQVNTADELVGAALQRAAGALRGHRVEVDVPGDALLAGRFDFGQALRALVNLLENAAKYAPADAPIVVRVRREGERLSLAVLDRGPGVPPAERDRIFEAFYRPAGTPPDVRGTGLGLSIARGLAEAQGGTLRHAPRDGGGSAFVLELPATDAPGDDAEPPAIP
ncbi:MAG: GAF domain-containing sensor histidine kinase, partial [Gemmatirosa sp.]